MALHDWFLMFLVELHQSLVAHTDLDDENRSMGLKNLQLGDDWLLSEVSLCVVAIFLRGTF